MQDLNSKLLPWMKTHATLLFPHDDAGNIHYRPQMPRFYLGRTINGNICRTRSDLPASVTHRLEELAASEPAIPSLSDLPVHADAYESILAESKTVEHRWAGPAYSFPQSIPHHDHEVVVISPSNIELLKPAHSDWIPAVGHGDPVCALLAEDRVAAICFSSRVNREACEAGVDTSTEFRGRGYAVAVVSSWAAAVRSNGLEPLYSTSSANTASQTVANKLGLLPIGMDFHLT